MTVIVERNGEPLAQGRARRLATRAQRRALLARDGGCVRPGCDETRIERLHAHHLRHWLHGGRTDVSNMVLLCDVDHGLVRDQELVMARRRGRLVVLTRDGRRIWGRADAAFSEATVLPLRRRPANGGPPEDTLAPLLPDRPGVLPDALGGDGERMQLGHVVWALLAHRDFLRRQAA